MIPRLRYLLLSTAIVLVGCGSHAGQKQEEYVLPDQVKDFKTLYGANCAGCHGQNGRYGAARPLNDSLYLALIGKGRLREVIAKGIPNTTMAPFAQDAGGTLTDQQIRILADQIMARWSSQSSTAALPPYSAQDAEADGLEPGNAKRGEEAFRRYCASCHGVDGTGRLGTPGGSAVDPAYLALVSNQSLRTTVIDGRSDEGIPDWRDYIHKQPMKPQEISDVVAWLAAQRKLQTYAAKGEMNLK
ncbi:MAG TPA: c-type cytochrome [Bryobacteraceae bacterium]|jgi:mono/diheme cytochrome c family protein|nr:c-type cytochrome [Bryobacteraceae bacterium]